VFKKIMVRTRREPEANTPRLLAVHMVKVTRSRPRRYDQAVRQALAVLWEASDRMCAKRLKSLFPVLLPALERHGHLHLDPATRAKLFVVSAASIDRLLRDVRTTQTGDRGLRRPAIQRRNARSQVPIRGAGLAPGYVEIRLSSHRRQFDDGSDTPTLSVTDLFSGWAECAPLPVCEQSEVLRCVETLRDRLPFRIRGVALSDGLSFLADALQHWDSGHAVEVFRSPPFRDCDFMPACAGSRRLEGPSAVEALSRLYTACGLYSNFFHCSFRLKDKRRVGSRMVKRYYAPQTPCARLLDSNVFCEQGKLRLQSIAKTLDPLQLLTDIRDLQSHLPLLADALRPNTPRSHRRRCDSLLSSPDRVLRAVDVRTLEAPKPQRHWRTHKNAFEVPWPIIQSWLEVESHQTSKELFERLRREYPGVYREGQLRSLQRRLNQWRNRTDAGVTHTTTTIR
jgi:hypothetical protein